MNGRFSPAALLAWCLDHIECDACQGLGGRYYPPTGTFICDPDLRLIHLLQKNAPPLPDTE